MSSSRVQSGLREALVGPHYSGIFWWDFLWVCLEFSLGFPLEFPLDLPLEFRPGVTPRTSVAGHPNRLRAGALPGALTRSLPGDSAGTSLGAPLVFDRSRAMTGSREASRLATHPIHIPPDHIGRSTAPRRLVSSVLPSSAHERPLPQQPRAIGPHQYILPPAKAGPGKVHLPVHQGRIPTNVLT